MKMLETLSLRQVPNTVRAAVIALGLTACNSSNNPDSSAGVDPTAVVNQSIATLDRDMAARTTVMERLARERDTRQAEITRLAGLQERALAAICRLDPSHRGCEADAGARR